jgi:signal peptidase I
MKNQAKGAAHALAQDHTPKENSSRYVRQGGELCLSSRGQLDLLRAMRERGVSTRTMVRGWSMSPFIRDRDVLTIVPIDSGRLRVGDIVAFSHPKNKKLVIHRIIRCMDSVWLLKGDNSPKPDGIIGQKDIVGLVSGIERKKRKVGLGLGVEKNLIALLSRFNLLIFLKKIWHMPRRALGLLWRKPCP